MVYLFHNLKNESDFQENIGGYMGKLFNTENNEIKTMFGSDQRLNRPCEKLKKINLEEAQN